MHDCLALSAQKLINGSFFSLDHSVDQSSCTLSHLTFDTKESNIVHTIDYGLDVRADACTNLI